MKLHPHRYDAPSEIVTETLTVGLPARTKQALAETARMRGTTMSNLAREAVMSVIARDGRIKHR